MRNKTFWFILVVLLCLSLVKVLLSARLATSGTNLAQAEVKSQQLIDQNRLLNKEIIEHSSLIKISSEAAKLGLVKNEKVVNLTLEVPVALRESR